MASTPPSGSDLSRWALALQTRIEADGGAPFRYTTRGVADLGRLQQATYLSALLPKVPEGFQADSLVLRMVTAAMDAPLAWPRRLLRIVGHRLEGRTPEMDPVEPPVWTLDLLPPTTTLPTGFVVDLVGLHTDANGETYVLVSPGTLQVPSGPVLPGPLPLTNPVDRGRAFCAAAWALVDTLGLTGVASVDPIAMGARVVPGEGGLVREVQVVMHLTFTPDTGVQWAPLHAVFDAASPEVRQAIEHVQRLPPPSASPSAP